MADLIEQIRWERDVAIQQLKELGYGLGEKIRTDGDTISRQAAIDALREYIVDNGIYDMDENVQGFNDGISCAISELSVIPSAQPEQRWIPCSERLPEDEYVLISKKPTMISGSKWSVAIAIRTADPRSRKVQWRDSGFGVIQDDKVLAWMPLPEPYRGG